MRSGVNEPVLPCRRSPARCGLALLLGALLLAPPALAQEKKPGLTDVLGKVQSDADKRAVNDLVDKLKGVPRKAPEAQPTPAATPPAVASPSPASPSPASTPAPKTATPAPATAPAAPAQPGRVETPPVPRVATPSTPAPPAAPAPAPMAPEEAIKKAETKEAPSVDFEVYFAYDSADITPQAVPILTTLGRALRDAALADDSFLIAGHTDTKGGWDYNLALSQRRAESVRRYLVDNFGIDPKKLVAEGFAYKHLKNKSQPRAAENRRVQIVNLSKDAPEARR
jgi:outer membrane protein OmpA-like peptidoglycan-associated protein